MRIAVIGDIHGQWDAGDCAAIDAGGYDLALFVGDLPGRLHLDTLAVARRIAPLRTRALLIPGNHDATTPLGVLAEALAPGSWATTRAADGPRITTRWEALQEALGPVQLCGYSVHPFPDHDVTVIAARPHAMDGRHLSFSPALAHRHGVDSLGASIARLRSLVDAAPGRLVFVAHNGPSGLGADPEAPFALRRGRDLGDPDLADAVAWAVHGGRRVAAVIAGHLHHQGHDRRWAVHRSGVAYVNAARVPRWRGPPSERERHHVAVTVGDEVTVDEVWARDAGGRPVGYRAGPGPH